jgi:hypothetical protein
MPINLNDFLNNTYTGYTGSIGNIGFTGSKGISGEYAGKGFTGSHGYTGSRAYTGSSGFGGSRGFVGYTGSSGFAANAAVFTGYIQEQTYALTDSATITIYPSNGTIQYLNSLGASRTIDTSAFVDGQGVTLMINDNSGVGSITTWSTVVWINNAKVAPSWPDSGTYTVISLWKVNGTVYGALVGNGS